MAWKSNLPPSSSPSDVSVSSLSHLYYLPATTCSLWTLFSCAFWAFGILEFCFCMHFLDLTAAVKAEPSLSLPSSSLPTSPLLFLLLRLCPFIDVTVTVVSSGRQGSCCLLCWKMAGHERAGKQNKEEGGRRRNSLIFLEPVEVGTPVSAIKHFWKAKQTCLLVAWSGSHSSIACALPVLPLCLALFSPSVVMSLV